VQNCQHTEQQ